MTAATEATTVVEHAVRYTWPGDDVPRVRQCEDHEVVLALMDILAGQGVTIMEPVTRVTPEWSIDRAGLPAAVRHLAEARLDGQLDDGDVRARLALWLADSEQRGLEATRAWRDLLAAIVAHRDAEDGPLPEDADREALVAEQEKRIEQALGQIVGGDL
jgi:hypothetical protein